MKKLTYFGVFVGLSLIAWLVAWQGAVSIGATLSEIGVGVLLLLPIYAIYLAMGVVSWRLLFVPGREPPFAVSLNAIWIGSAVNTLLPVASLGGEAVKARLLTLQGIDASEAGGSVVGDTTVQALSLALWGLIGAALLAAVSFDRDMVWAAFLAAGLFCAGVFAFVLLQRKGIFAYVGKRLAGQTFGDRLLEFDR
ncbi:MAG: lysylphosphatidylglycerol synthase domain-containing protein, partial [Pseudomonadota bacterium]|nr:lysylphosphatidylglycerol synthase domain-containing protein [Pseudomonadota bacterium]